MSILEKEIMDFAQQLAASENGCACSDDDPPDPTPEQYEYAKERLLKEAKVGRSSVVEDVLSPLH